MLIAVLMLAKVVHKCHGNIGALFRKLVRGSVRLIETFKCNLFKLFKFFILVSCLKQIDKVMFVAEEKWMIHILLHFSLSIFCFFFGGIIWILMKSIIFVSKTINQNVHEPKFLPIAKIFKKCSFFRTSSIFTTFPLQTVNKNRGKGGIEIWLYKNFLKILRKTNLNCSFVIK